MDSNIETLCLPARRTGAPAWIRTKDVYFIRVEDLSSPLELEI
jgi:hypothetical protein